MVEKLQTGQKRFKFFFNVRFLLGSPKGTNATDLDDQGEESCNCLCHSLPRGARVH